ncbi:hypothetical protein ACWD0A_24250 [Streptomyces sp. NPDC002867]
MGAWHIPEADKRVLADVGVPHSDDVPLTRVCFQSEAEPTVSTADGGLLYLLAEVRSQVGETTWWWAVEPAPGWCTT